MKKKKDEAAAGFRETLRATLRAYKIWNRYAPKLLTSTALYSVFSALSPYVPVYFSAQILNELAGARDPERLTTLALLTLSVTAALAIVTALLRAGRRSAPAQSTSATCSSRSTKCSRWIFRPPTRRRRMSCSPRCGRTRIGPGTA